MGRGVGSADEGGDVEVAGEVEAAGAGFMGVPEGVHAESVEAQGAHYFHAVTPILARDAGSVQFAGAVWVAAGSEVAAAATRDRAWQRFITIPALYFTAEAPGGTFSVTEPFSCYFGISHRK